MKKSLPALALLWLLVPIVGFAQTSAVRETYEEFDNLMLAKDGGQAFELLSEDSQKFVEEVREISISADRESLLEQPLPVILAVFSVRSAADGKAPASGGQTLVDMARGYEESSAVTEMGEITINGNTASGAILVNGNPNPIDYSFVKEDGAWKVDMASQMKETEELMLGPIKASGMSKDKFLDQIAEAMKGEFSVDVWQPIGG